MTNTNLSVFQPLITGNIKLKNRFVRAAANEHTTDEERRKKFYTDLASNDVALIYTGGLTLNKIPAYAPIADIMHSYDSKLVIQIVYTEGIKGGIPDANKNYMAVSQLPPEHPFFDNVMVFYSKNYEMTEDDIWKMIKYYGVAAKAAVEAGADFIGIHSSHQNLLLQFISPLTNKRTDKWGGTIENRTRIHREIIKTIRAEIGSSVPVILKIGIEDSFPGGLEEREGLKAVEILSGCGFDIIEVSQGLMDLKNSLKGSPMRGPVKNESQEVFFREWSREAKKISPVPVMVTGGVKSLEVAEEVLTSGDADLLGVCRPLLREPGLIKRWQNGNTEKAKCLFCNKCLETLTKGNLECKAEK
jgi:2,4-dienoyl-CoA reductase-like NADH-dependent reductase (Old Yellow Enzyme family)